MAKSLKIVIALVFVVFALLSCAFSYMIVGMGVSGSGCGTGCMDNMKTAQNVSWFFWVLALLTCLLPVKKTVSESDDHRQDLDKN